MSTKKTRRLLPDGIRLTAFTGIMAVGSTKVGYHIYGTFGVDDKTGDVGFYNVVGQRVEDTLLKHGVFAKISDKRGASRDRANLGDGRLSTAGASEFRGALTQLTDPKTGELLGSWGSLTKFVESWLRQMRKRPDEVWGTETLAIREADATRILSTFAQ